MNKLLVITGGTKGIGRAIIDRFASEGFDIVTCSRKMDDLQSLKRDIQKRFSGVELYVRTCDLSKKEEAQGFARFVSDLGRPVDVLVNNAGLFVPGQIHTEEDGNLEFMLQTNLHSAYHVTRGLVGEMKNRKDGYIFNICSTASIIPYVNGGSYCISKFALLGMSKVLREEMKSHGVRVTAVMPGATYTASWEGVDLPEERFMKAEDVAEAVWAAFALSKHSVVEEILIRPQLGDI
jgi:short-subunit dehydrogenase